MAPADPETAARSVCLRQLTMGPRSRGQLAAALAGRGVDEKVAERVLDRLTEVGLLDDVAFAELWVRSRSLTRGLSRRAIAEELRTRGVSEEILAGALAARSDEDEVESARVLVQRRLASTRRVPVVARTRRLVAMLARKGYSSGLALRVVREALSAEAVEPAGVPAGQ